MYKNANDSSNLHFQDFMSDKRLGKIGNNTWHKKCNNGIRNQGIQPKKKIRLCHK